MSDSSNWLNQTLKLPIAFAQVREDPFLDLELVKSTSGKSDILMIASGGCTAALLATSSKIGRIHLVDPNEAQLALTRFKLHLLRRESPANRLKILGHAPMLAAARKSKIKSILTALNLNSDILGPLAFVSRVGPDQSGRYEQLFMHLRNHLNSVKKALEEIMHLKSLERQTRMIDSKGYLWKTLVHAFESSMTLPVLVKLFGTEATANRAQPFSKHFIERTRIAFTTMKAATNPFLAQLLLGHYLKGSYAPWLSMKAPRRWPHITWQKSLMATAMETSRRAYDVVHLSNILDWLSPQEAKATLDKAYSVLKPNGIVIVRQLNSALNIPQLGKKFRWDDHMGETFLRKDRSFFYRNIFIGRRGR